MARPRAAPLAITLLAASGIARADALPAPAGGPAPVAAPTGAPAAPGVSPMTGRPGEPPPPPPAGALPYPYPAWPPGAPPMPMYYGWPPPAAEPPTRWYGWQTLVTDAGWVVGLPAAFATREGNPNDTLLGLSILDYFLGAPIVHWAHGSVGKGFGSLGMRAAPLVLGILAATRASGGGSEYSNDLKLGATIILIGVPAAVIIDAGVLAYEDVKPGQSARATPTLVPRVSIARERTTLGIGGTF
jgi:hypothetical protein